MMKFFTKETGEQRCRYCEGTGKVENLEYPTWQFYLLVAGFCILLGILGAVYAFVSKIELDWVAFLYIGLAAVLVIYTERGRWE